MPSVSGKPIPSAPRVVAKSFTQRSHHPSGACKWSEQTWSSQAEQVLLGPGREQTPQTDCGLRELWGGPLGGAMDPLGRTDVTSTKLVWLLRWARQWSRSVLSSGQISES